MDEMLRKEDVLKALSAKIDELVKVDANADVVLGLACAMSVVELMEGEPAEKVGRWIKIDDCSNSGYYCSKCQKRVVKEGWSDTVKTIKYCPNCGAKMEEVDDK